MRGKREIRAYLGRSGSLGDKEEPANRENGNYGEEGRAFVLPTEKHHGRYCRGWGLGWWRKKGGSFGDKENRQTVKTGIMAKKEELLSCRQKNTTGDIAGDEGKKGVVFRDIFHDKPVAAWIFLWGYE
ncbi:hypothetical protein CEXT_492541 [Caerostris extrusa]|uniref:Uncharacterized protein n=1 Tax=Caerostris extrusa TaxID=172846 RepID=A0AAV4X7F1_CAEEX|nr:hypothetical protein CEXT_492541 [Caerostris extrusa]